MREWIEISGIIKFSGPINLSKIGFSRLDSKPDYQESRVNEDPTHSELSSSEKSQCFEVGDLIWGPVKGYVSWPGKLVRKGDEGNWHVKWFGDKPPGIVDGAKLFTLSEGLEAHHTARTKHRK